MVNVWDITLRIEGKDTLLTSDIVLVIDTSGSMSGNKMTSAINAAKSFVDTLLPSETTRIGIVPFASEVGNVTQLTNQVGTLIDAIEALAAVGGTFTQAGVKQAEEMLAASAADMKHIVLLSDGRPTYSYDLNNRDDYLIPYGERNREIGTGAPSTAYTSTQVGDGGNLREYYGRDWVSTGFLQGYWSNKYYNHGNSAIAEAGFAKTSGYRVWTIALDVDTTGRGILQQMASDDSYFTATASDLNTVFGTIAGEIGAAVKEAKVTDPMGAGFQVPIGEVSNITATQGTPEYNSTTRTITWEPGTLTTPISPGSDIKYAELKYRVELNDDILLQTPDENGEYPTNGSAIIRYTDAAGNAQEKPFPVPRVNPVLYKVVKVLQDKDGNVITVDRDFDIKITGPWADGVNEKIFTLNPFEQSGTKLLTDLRWDETYTFSETSTNVGNLADYDITYIVNGVETNSFVVAGDQTEDVEVKVVNKEKPGSITIIKKLDQSAIIPPPSPAKMSDSGEFGLTKSGAKTSQVKFDFEVIGPNGYAENFSLPENNSWEKVLDGLAKGIYTIKETTTGWTTTMQVNQDPEVSASEVNVTLDFPNLKHTVTVTNKQTENMTVTAEKIWEYAPTDKPDIWFQLIRINSDNSETFVGEPKKVVNNSVTWNQSDTGLTEKLLKYDENGNLYSYKVQEVDEDGNDFVPAGYSKVENGLTVTNSFIQTSDTDITSIRFEKTWEGVPENLTPPNITVQVIANSPILINQVVRTAVLTYPNVVVEWKDLPLKDAEENIITYTINEKPINDFNEGDPVVTESAIENVYCEPSQNQTDWPLQNPAFIITRITGHKAFVVWTLNHVPAVDQVQLLRNVIAASKPAQYKQPLKDLESYLDQGGDAFIWLEGPNVSHDVLPNNPSSGLITVEVTFNPDGTVNETTIHFQGENIWTHFAVGSYSTKLVEITNTYNQETINLQLTKTWSDNNNQDGIRPAQVEFNIYDADDMITIVRTVTLTPENGVWQQTVTGLPKYKNFTTLINYVVVEVVPDDYIETHTQNGNNWAFKNTYTPATTEKTVSKVWDDNNNQDGKRTDVTLKLVATVDGTEVSWAD
ncbi:MAG: Cna B-type domain-containing protein, partial [Bacillota bacterium]|nr:Cna B-type domain-containing protein [Bacillota bacterium]